MASSKLKDPIWVDTPSALQRLAADLENCDQVAVDTESNSLFVYREQVCLIQFSNGHEDYLVDTLALKDLSPLAPVFSSARVEKIFHAAEYDIICLKRDFGFIFANIFDTMLAARIVGHKGIGLAAMLEKEFGVKVNKRFQRANWGMRPLPKEQLDYARMDTHYLIALRAHLAAQLQEKGLAELAQEDFNRLPDVQITTQDNGLAHFWRLASKGETSSRQLAVLYELYQYRDQVARKRNKPPFKILNDRLLLEIAQQLPLSQEELNHIPGVTRKIRNMHARGLLHAVESGYAKKPPKRPHRSYPNGRFLELHDALRNWRKKTARKNGFESDIVLPRDVLEDIARQDPDNLDQLEGIMQDLPWRFEKYGNAILNLIHHLEGK